MSGQTERASSAPQQAFELDGRILYLTEDAALLKQQLAGPVDVPFEPDRPLLDNISTDEITPGWVCFYYDETLGDYVYVGLRGGTVQPHEVKRGGFRVAVSGKSKGCGSSRETAPFAELSAGIRLVIARSHEKIYRQNCQNIGLYTSTDFGLIPRLQRGEAIPVSEFTRGLDPVSAQIVEHGGLLEYSKARLSGRVAPPPVKTAARPMNLAEKIIAAAAVADAKAGRLGIPAVAPGDALFVRAAVRFTHDYVTPMAAAIFKRSFGPDARVVEPESTYAFRDHLTFLDKVMPQKQRDMGLLDRANALATTQEAFCVEQGIRLYREVDGGGSEAICHNAVVEDLALPGTVVIGTDSHTCMAGVLGCFAFGVGSTDMANAWFTRDVRVTVPETVRVELRGRKGADVSAKDVMLKLLADEHFKSGRGIGQVLEFGGPGLASLAMDERATLTNMAVEAGSTTGIMEPDEVTVAYLAKMRGLAPDAVREMIVRGDAGASYAHRIEIDLDALVPMVALPGDPRNGIPLTELEAASGGAVKIDIAYGGSCTGGKMADMDMYASVLRDAQERGLRVADGVHLYLQYGSQKIKEYARQQGYDALFRAVGAEVIDPSCGACIKAGPGSSERPDQVTVSAQNRNFPGRSGPGKVYLTNPLVVAASAIAGRIVGPSWVRANSPPGKASK